MRKLVPLVGRTAFIAQQYVVEGAFPAIDEKSLLPPYCLVHYAVLVIDYGVGPNISYLVGTHQDIGIDGLYPWNIISPFMQTARKCVDIGVGFTTNEGEKSSIVPVSTY